MTERVATIRSQSRKFRYTYRGEERELSVGGWAKETGIPQPKLQWRLDQVARGLGGWTMAQALGEAPRPAEARTAANRATRAAGGTAARLDPPSEPTVPPLDVDAVLALVGRGSWGAAEYEAFLTHFVGVRPRDWAMGTGTVRHRALARFLGVSEHPHLMHLHGKPLLERERRLAAALLLLDAIALSVTADPKLWRALPDDLRRLVWAARDFADPGLSGGNVPGLSGGNVPGLSGGQGGDPEGSAE